MKIHRTIAFFSLALVSVACQEEFGTDLDTDGDPAPAAIQIVSGDAQVGEVGQALGQPLVVRVLDQFDDPYQGATVTWSTAQGTVSSSSTSTNADGEASVTWTLGETTGSQTATAALSDTEDVTFTATAEESSPACDISGTLAVPGSVNGTLEAGDCVTEDSYYYDGWTVEITEETTYTFSLTSSDFDAYFVLLDDEGNVVDFNDDGGEGTNSELTLSLSPGTYIAIATSYFEEETGAYTLSVAVGGAVQALSFDTADKEGSAWAEEVPHLEWR